MWKFPEYVADQEEEDKIRQLLYNLIRLRDFHSAIASYRTSVMKSIREAYNKITKKLYALHLAEFTRDIDSQQTQISVDEFWNMLNIDEYQVALKVFTQLFGNFVDRQVRLTGILTEVAEEIKTSPKVVSCYFDSSMFNVSALSRQGSGGVGFQAVEDETSGPIVVDDKKKTEEAYCLSILQDNDLFIYSAR